MKVQQLTLFTGHLRLMRKFYTQVLGLRLVNESHDRFSVQAGSSVLTFEVGEGNEQYHIAFNIPGRSIHGALEWLEERTEVLVYEEEPIVDFSDWCAEAVYFKDPAGNILEFIERRNLNLPPVLGFSARSILSISEVGIPLPNIASQADELKTAAGMPVYWGKTERFQALGDENGLLIMVGDDWTWLPDATPVRVSDLHMTFHHEGGLWNLRAENGHLHIEKAIDA